MATAKRRLPKARDERLAIRLTRDEKRRLELAAVVAGRKPADWIRWLALRAAEDGK